MTDSKGVVIEAQADYLRVSAHGERQALALEEWAEGQLLVQKIKPNRVRPWALMGYSGSHCGQISYGRRDKRAVIVDLIGDLAAKELHTVLPLGDHCTRVDLAVTWRADPPDPKIGPNAFSEAAAHYAEHQTSARPSRISDADGGWTTYIGKRTSETFFRIYDKGKESIEKQDKEGFARYENCWRFELEAKGTVSLPLATALDHTEDPARFTIGYISSYLLAHGVTPPFQPMEPSGSSPGSGGGPMPTPSYGTFRGMHVRAWPGSGRMANLRLLWPR